jgi:hypothetical protein
MLVGLVEVWCDSVECASGYDSCIVFISSRVLQPPLIKCLMKGQRWHHLVVDPVMVTERFDQIFGDLSFHQLLNQKGQ